jgi:DNA-binding MarR family transcriptional regulator
MRSDDRLIYLIFKAQQKLRTHLSNLMVRENVKVTPAQAGILFLLAEKEGRTMSELSQILSMDNSTITGLVDRLEKA